VITIHRNSDTLSTPAAEIAVLLPATSEFVFDYNDDAVIQLQQQQQEEEDLMIEAIPIPDNATKLNYAGVSDDSRSSVNNAKQIGRYKSKKELDAIRKAKERIIPHNYYKENSIKKANEIALRRDREGLLQARRNNDDHRLSNNNSAILFSSSTTKSNKKDNDEEEGKKKSSGASSSGYQIKEYKVSSYDTKNYDVTKYKSVYD